MGCCLISFRVFARAHCTRRHTPHTHHTHATPRLRPASLRAFVEGCRESRNGGGGEGGGGGGTEEETGTTTTTAVWNGCDVKIGARVVRTINALYRSAHSGAEVVVDLE